MRIFKFDTRKHGREFLMDLGQFQDTPNYFFQPEPHTVDFYEIMFFRKINGQLRLGSHMIDLHDRMIVYASPYQPRAWFLEDTEIEGYFFSFANQFLETFFADPLFVFRFQFFHNDQHPNWMNEANDSYSYHEGAFRKIKAELDDPKEDSEDFIRAFLLLILAGHNRRYCQTYGLSPGRSTNHKAFAFKKLVEENIRKIQKIDEFAEILQINRITLNKMVKRQFGVTASDFIKERLASEAKRDLMYTGKTVAEIAFGLGFSEGSALTRFFKRHTGRSPREYRDHYQMVN